MFPFLHRMPGLWIPPEGSLGSGAKTAALSLLYQTGVKSTNRLLWPNVIKLQPGSGTVSVPVLSVPCELHIHRAAAQPPPPLKKKLSLLSGLGWLSLVELPHCGKPASLVSTAGSSVEVMSEDGALHAASQCGVPPAAQHWGGRAKSVSEHICADSRVRRPAANTDKVLCFVWTITFPLIINQWDAAGS